MQLIYKTRRYKCKPTLENLLRTWWTHRNSHDLDAILNHYSDDFELTSPLIKEKLDIEDGTIRGKDGVRQWWQRAIDKYPDLQTEFIEVAESIESIVFIQRISYTDKITVSNFYFNDEGKIRKEIYFH